MRKADEVAVEFAARRHRGCSHGQCGRREAIVLRPDNSRDLDALRSRQVTPPGDHLGFIQVRSPKNARTDDRLSLLRISVHRVFYADYDTSSICRHRDLSVLAVGLRAERHPAGTVLFARGDKGDAAFLVAKGEVEIAELHKKLGAGHLFGEVALLSPDGVRIATCATDVELYRIDASAFGRTFYQNTQRRYRNSRSTK